MSPSSSPVVPLFSGIPSTRQPRLLDQVRAALRIRHYSRRTEKAYIGWIRRFIFFHGKRHPAEMGEAEVSHYLSHLATERKVSASTQNQALAALLLLYQEVLGRKLGWMDQIARAKRPQHVPVVLSRAEVSAVLRHLQRDVWLVAALLYGSGLRLLEALRLRIKDVDVSQHMVVVRRGKGAKDRHTVLPDFVIRPLTEHLDRVHRQHDRDLAVGAGCVELPDAYRAKNPAAVRSWPWQWIFPATRIYTHTPTGERRRHHLHETVIQRAIKTAVIGSGIAKSASAHSLRHYAVLRIIPRAGHRQGRFRRAIRDEAMADAG